MPQPLIVGMTPDVVVSGSYRLRLTALSPTTGAQVTGVKVSLGAVSARNLTVGIEDDGVPAPTDTKNSAVLLPGPAM